MTRLCILAMCTVALIPHSASAQMDDSWKLSKNKKEISIYTRKVEGVGLKEFNAQMTVDATVDEVKERISAVDDYTSWMHNMVGCSKSEETDEGFLTYCHQAAPWPARDRDIAVRLKFEPLDGGGFYVRMICEPEAIKLNEDLIRVTKVEGFWKVYPLEDGSTHVEQQVLADPAGVIPLWLANMVVTDNPYKSYQALRSLLEGNEAEE